MNGQTPKLGTPVSFSHYVEKYRNPDGSTELRHIPVSYLEWNNVQTMDGLFIGKRTWSIGTLDQYPPDLEYGFEVVYKPTNYYTIWLIVFNRNRKPVAVLPEHVLILDGE